MHQLDFIMMMIMIIMRISNNMFLIGKENIQWKVTSYLRLTDLVIFYQNKKEISLSHLVT